MIEESPAGTDVVLTGAWNRKAVEQFTSGAATGLVLNYARGFQERDLEFLRGLPLQRLAILSRTLKDLAPVYTLGDTLVDLRVEVDDRAELDLSRTPNLQRLSAHWSQVRQTISGLRSLKRLFIRGYSERNLASLSINGALEIIDFKDNPALESLDGVDDLPWLAELGVFAASRLIDFGVLGRGSYPVLRRLQVPYCRGLTDLSDIANCEALSFLDASERGSIASAKPLAHLLLLNRLHLYGTTNFLDPDISAIATLPSLIDLRIQSRRSYEPKVSEIQATLAAR